jgi:hypothetical protein
MLILATSVIAFAFMDEMRDIKNVLFRVRDAPSGTWGSAALKLLMLLHTSIRQFVFLPLLLCVSPLFILRIGSDSLNICLNTVAVLFLLDIDNQVFKHMLPTHVRAHFQAAPPHELMPGDTTELNASNYLCFLTVFIVRRAALT